MLYFKSALGPIGTNGLRVRISATAEMVVARVCAHVSVNTIQMPRAAGNPCSKKGAIHIRVQVSSFDHFDINNLKIHRLEENVEMFIYTMRIQHVTYVLILLLLIASIKAFMV